MTINRDRVAIWTKDAQSKLHEAQLKCTKAQTVLQKTAYGLTMKLTNKQRLCAFLIKAFNQQHQLLQKVVESLEQRVVGDIIENFENDWEQQVAPTLNELEKVLRYLKEAQVPLFLLRENERNQDGDTEQTEKTLYDFISLEDVTTLRDNIEIYYNNSRKIHRMLEQNLKEMLIEPFQESAVKRYRRIMKTYEKMELVLLDIHLEHYAVTSKLRNIINAILKENDTLERELVSLLEMLTNHYDQCCQCLKLFERNTFLAEGDKNLEVLENDVIELPNVLKELNSIYQIILNNEKRADKFLEVEVGQNDALILSIREYITFCQEYRAENLSKFMVLVALAEKELAKSAISDSQDHREHFEPRKAYLEAMNHLIYYYKLFIRVYKTKYLQEYLREKYLYPRDFLSRLESLFNNSLLQIQNSETEKRKNWLLQYGEFIPKEFELPGEQRQPSVVQVITEGLDDVQTDPREKSSLMYNEEKQLVEYIKNLNG